MLILLLKKLYFCYRDSLKKKDKNTVYEGEVRMSDQLTTLKLKPLGDRVLVKREEEEDAVRGGIILPDTAKKKQDKAVVVALGTGKRNDNGETIPFEVQVGDTVLMDKYAGQEVSVDGEEFVILQASEIMAVIN